MADCIDIMAAGGEICQKIISPEFSTLPPHIINKEIIPHNIVNAMTKGWFTEVHPQKDVCVFIIKDVFVTEEGLVITEGGKVISQSVTQHDVKAMERAVERIKNKKFLHIPEKTLLMRKRGDANYGHWHVEVLPKLWLIDGKIKFDNILIPRGRFEMNRVYRDSIAISSYNEYQKIYASNEDVYKVSELLIVDGMTDHGTYMSPLVFSRTDEILNKINGSGYKKIFISREGCPRTLHEEGKFFDIISEMGFVKINPQDMTYLEQIRYLKDADIVVGVLGAGLTNIMFCKKNANIVSICPASMPDTFFYLMSQLRGYNYVEIREQNPDGGLDRNSHILWDSITINEIRKYC